MASPSLTTTPSSFPAACTFNSEDGLLSNKVGQLVGCSTGPWGQQWFVEYLDSNSDVQTSVVKTPSKIALT